MVATVPIQHEGTIQLKDVYRLSVDQYHQMLESGILISGDPVELLEGLLIRKWPSRYFQSDDAMYVEQFHPLSVAQYHEMGRLGILTDDDRVELLEGVIFKRMSILPPHTGTVIRLTETIKPELPQGWRYRQEQPIILEDGEPLPDGVVAKGTSEDNFRFHPTASDVALIIEVADASLRSDRTVKLRSYARASIAVYWIINLIDRQIEVYTQPNASASVPAYDSVQIFNSQQSVPLMVDGKLVSEIAVKDLLPAVIAT